MNYLKTTEKKQVENYPYGYSQKTTAFFSLDFNKNRGFRTVFQTVNPKTGLLNKPKYSTYSPLRVLTEDNGKISSYSPDYYGDEGMEKTIKFLGDQYELFTLEQIKSLAITTIAYIKADIYAKATYCGSDIKALLPLYDEAMKTLVKIANTGENLFNTIKIDFQSIKALAIEGYNPFKVTTYSINTD